MSRSYLFISSSMQSLVRIGQLLTFENSGTRDWDRDASKNPGLEPELTIVFIRDRDFKQSRLCPEFNYTFFPFLSMFGEQL